LSAGSFMVSSLLYAHSTFVRLAMGLSPCGCDRALWVRGSTFCAVS
jgi:hypothetical protein